MQNSEENNQNENKTPSKMARLAWPKAKYGVILAILIIIGVNLIYYKDFFLSFFKLLCYVIRWQKIYLKFQNKKKLNIF